jgi:hypothetical protein
MRRSSTTETVSRKQPVANRWATAFGALLALGVLLLWLPPIFEDRLNMKSDISGPLTSAGQCALGTAAVILCISLAVQVHRRTR